MEQFLINDISWELYNLLLLLNILKLLFVPQNLT